MTSYLLTANNVHKSYGDLEVLRGISLAFSAGESVAIMGPSGSGKTTLLHCLAAILPADSGHIVLQTRDSSTQDITQLSQRGRDLLRRSEYGFVFQQGLLVPELTVLENIALPLMIAGSTRVPAEAAALGLLQQLGLQDWAQHFPGQISGGQAQRVAIARALITQPGIVFADEPTGALDTKTSAQVLQLLLNTAVGPSSCLIMVTHNMEVAKQCSRIINLVDGKIVQNSEVSA